MESATDPDALVERVDALLPQTQCTRCGYPSCADYARAMVTEGVPINRCPPGGDEGMRALADLLGRPGTTLDPDCGAPGPRLLAFIESDDCIGCTKCIRACPLDAIIGGPKAMHTVIPALCSGCELCVPPCPTDCIRIVALDTPWSDDDARLARERFGRRRRRLERERRDDLLRHERELSGKRASLVAPGTRDDTGSDESRVDAGRRGAGSARSPDPSRPATTSEPRGAARNPAPAIDDQLARKRAVLDAALARARARLDARPPKPDGGGS
ncbi:MAG: RnfABCDGE type electron transport complex subunit B [Burkholderiaceae bacterium]